MESRDGLFECMSQTMNVKIKNVYFIELACFENHMSDFFVQQYNFDVY